MACLINFPIINFNSIFCFLIPDNFTVKLRISIFMQLLYDLVPFSTPQNVTYI